MRIIQSFHILSSTISNGSHAEELCAGIGGKVWLNRMKTLQEKQTDIVIFHQTKCAHPQEESLRITFTTNVKHSLFLNGILSLLPSGGSSQQNGKGRHFGDDRKAPSNCSASPI